MVLYVILILLWTLPLYVSVNLFMQMSFHQKYFNIKSRNQVICERLFGQIQIQIHCTTT